MSSGHAILSPSGAEKWMSCLGSVVLEAGEPNESSSYADEGTAAHLLASTCLALKIDPATYEGRSVYFWKLGIEQGTGWFLPKNDQGTENHPDLEILNEVGVTSEMVGYVVEYISALETYTGMDGILYEEQRMSISHLTGEEGAEGTADAVILLPGEIQVHDLKYGMGNKVSAQENKQLQIYALAALEKYGLYDDFKTVRMVIHQPRLGWQDEYCITVEELLEFAKEVKLAAAIINEEVQQYAGPGAEFGMYLSPGIHCSKNFCRAQATCPALKRYVLASCQFEDVTDKLIVRDNTDLADSKSKIEIIQAWCKAVDSKVWLELNLGHEVPGYKLTVGREGNRAWVDEPKAVAHLTTLGMTSEQMYKKSLISPADAEKTLKLGKKRKAELDVVIKRNPGQLIVVPITDKRETVADGLGFEDISGEEVDPLTEMGF